MNDLFCGNLLTWGPICEEFILRILDDMAFLLQYSFWWRHPRENLSWRGVSFNERFNSRRLMTWHCFSQRSYSFLWHYSRENMLLTCCDVILMKPSRAAFISDLIADVAFDNSGRWYHPSKFLPLTSSSWILVIDVIFANFGRWHHPREPCLTTYSSLTRSLLRAFYGPPGSHETPVYCEISFFFFNLTN